MLSEVLSGPDRKTGHKRLVVAPTPQFFEPSTLARDDAHERDYNYRARRCQEHPHAGVTEIRDTTITRITRETVKRTFVCNECCDVLDSEGDRERRGS